MRPKLPNVALDKADTLRGKRIVEFHSVLGLFGIDDYVQRSAPPWSDQISLDIELY
jgi:hypothetical protein